MAYKTILLCLNEIERVPQLIAVARQLGVKFNAHISGLYVIPSAQVVPTDGYGVAPVAFDVVQKHFKAKLPKVREAFEYGMKEDKIAFDLRVVESSLPVIATDVIENCRHVDLVVVSAIDREKGDNVEADFVERIVMSAGRPVIVLPFKGETEIEFDDVMLGWNDSRESARATFDALPFMQRAKRTNIVTVDVAPRGTIEGANIAETLDRNGVKCEVLNVASGGMSTGETLLRAANDHGAGLLVLGAYGHTRLAEWVFGGATRYVLRNLDRPVLMSH